MINDDIEQAIGHQLDPITQAELDILLRGGVTPDDVHHAIAAYFRAYRVDDDWGYLRAVMLRRAADRMVLQNWSPA